MNITSGVKYIIHNYIELLATVLSLIYLYLSVKEKIGLWIFGFLCSVLYVMVFYNSKFYADMSLQIYYLGVSIYGWINWNKSQTSDNKIYKLKISTLTKSQLTQYAIIMFVIYLIYFVILKYYTDSPVPIMDSGVGALSVVATWMLAKKKIENWLLWIVANAIASGLFLYKQLYPTTVLYVFYTLMALIGYFQWRKSLKKNKFSMK